MKEIKITDMLRQPKKKEVVRVTQWWLTGMVLLTLTSIWLAGLYRLLSIVV